MFRRLIKLGLHLCTAHARRRHTRGAFAAIVGDGSVVTAGQYMFGGDCSSVRDQLKDWGGCQERVLYDAYCFVAVAAGVLAAVTLTACIAALKP